MAVSQSLPELVRAAQDIAKVSYDRISQILDDKTDQIPTEAQTEELAALTVAIELVAVDIFTVFEVRMQHHFKRGPLSRKVKAALLEAKQPDLADRLHQYYLAINVLKHGAGTSHRELLGNKSNLFIVRPTSNATTADGEALTGLVDVTAPQFMNGLADVIIEVYQFLENRS